VSVHLLVRVLVEVMRGLDVLLRLGLGGVLLVAVLLLEVLLVQVLELVRLLRRVDGRLLGLGVQERRLLLDVLWGCVCACVDVGLATRF